MLSNFVVLSTDLICIFHQLSYYECLDLCHRFTLPRTHLTCEMVGGRRAALWAAALLLTCSGAHAEVPPAMVGGGIMARLGLHLRAQPPLILRGADNLWEADSDIAQVICG